MPSHWDNEVRILAVCAHKQDLMSPASDRFKGLMTTIAAQGRWSLGARARRLPDCNRQCQAGFGMGAVTVACRLLVQVVAMVIDGANFSL